MRGIYKPFPDTVKLLDGELCASDILDPGTMLGISHVVDETYPGGKITTPLGGFLTHSHDPNAVLITFDRFWTLWTQKDILPNHPITIDKSKYDLPFSHIVDDIPE